MRRPMTDEQADCRIEEMKLAQNPNRIQGRQVGPGFVLIFRSRLEATCMKCSGTIPAGTDFTSAAFSGADAHTQAECARCRPVVRAVRK